MNTSYKLIRENFISGHNGTTPQHVLLLATMAQLSNLLLIAIISLFTVLTKNQYKLIRLLIEFIILFMPFVLSVTTLSDYYHIVFAAIIILIIAMICLCRSTKQNIKPINAEEILNIEVAEEYHIQGANNLKAGLLLGVCVSILAVDFRAFPRRLAKTELYGWSIMDAGVGGFIAINGGLSPESRLGTVNGYAPIFLLKKTLLSIIPLIVLGLQRLAAVKSVGYHEHITEYGVHWNFFFTLAFTKLFSTPFCCLISSKVNTGLMAIVFLVIHQISLTFCGLSDFIKNDYRDGVIAANKEGIISLFGFITLYLFFVEVGRNLLNMKYIKCNLRLLLNNCFILCCIAIISSTVMMLSHVYIEKISRRQANLAFVCWMITITCVLLVLEILIQIIIQICRHLNYFASGDQFKSALFHSMSYSGMIVFLFANLITGLVNFLCDTLSVTNSKSLLIILLYCAAFSVFAIVCTHKQIQLKFNMKTKKSV